LAANVKLKGKVERFELNPVDLFRFPKGKLPRHGAAFVVGLDDYRGIGEGGFVDLEGDFGGAGGIGDGLGIKGCGAGAGEAESETGAGDGSSAFGDSQAHGEITVGVNGRGVLPLDVQLFDGGQGFGFGAVEDVIQLAFANGFEDEAMLVAQLLLFLSVTKAGFQGGVGVGNCLLADTSAAHEDLGLEQFFALAGFALHVVDGVAVFDVGIEAENHKNFAIG
jgi:hypothetical protein